MGHRHIFEAIDRSLRDVRNDKRTFGGLTVLLAADWRQTLPVVVKGSRGQIVNSCLKSSYIWEHVKEYRLNKNMRILLNGEDAQFADYLTPCGDGQLPIEKDIGALKLTYPTTIHSMGI